MRAIAEGVWETTNEVWLPGRVCFEGRMVTLRLADGGLLLYSPVPIDDALAAALEAEGPVRHVVAPNLVHHLYAAAAKARFPDATLWAAPGLREKVGMSADAILSDAFPDDAITTLPLPSAPNMNETVIVHHPSRSLVVCDLVFNMRRTKGWGTPLMMRMVGCHGRLATSRSLVWYFAKDSVPELAASVRGLVERGDWDRLIMAHGDVVEAGGREALREGAARLLAKG